MTRIEETISTKIGSIWHTGAATRGGTIYIVDKDYNEEEAKEAVRAAKKTLREAGFAASVDYYWCHFGDKPLRMYIRTTKKQEEANAEQEAISALVEAWNETIAEGFGEIEMAHSLLEQVEGGEQGWDMSVDDAYANPEVAAMVGLDPEAEPENPDEMEDLWEAWGRVVGEAARRWMAGHPKAVQAAREENGTMTKQYESYKVATYFGAPQRRETEKAAMDLADKLRKKGRHGQVEGVWFDENGMHFDVIRVF